MAYIDDILGSEEMARDHSSRLIHLLENLGFIAHLEKTVTPPTQEIEFMGMVGNSQAMKL